MNPILALILFVALMFGLPHIMGPVLDKADKDASKGDGSCLTIIIIAAVLLAIISSVIQCGQLVSH